MNESANDIYINELSSGDLQFKSRLIEVLKRELPEEISKYQLHLAKQQYREASEMVHKIKHKISILGLLKSYTLAVQYEDELQSGILTRKNEFSTILDIMLAFLKKL